MIRRPPRSTLRTHSFPTRRSSDLPALAATLRRIAKKGRSAFYEGPVMEEIVKRLKELNGLHEPEDFAKQSSEYVEPVHAGYRGRSEEHTSELQSLMHISYAVFCLKKKTTHR